MLNERYMVSAVPVDGGKRVTGYLTLFYFDDVGLSLAIQDAHNFNKFYKIDPDTIEPVRVKAIKDFGWICPNCNQRSVSGKVNHCQNCGMALDHSGEG